MIRNYIKTAWRNITRNRAYALINIVGLSLALGMAIVIFCVVRFERGFDTFHTKVDRLYKLISYDTFDERNTHIPQGIIKALREQFPGVEQAATVYCDAPFVIRVGDQNLKQERVFFIHPEFLEMINVEWVQGSPETSLSEPYQVVLDEPTAQRLFNGDAMGKTIRYDNRFDITVSGIIRKSPANSDFQLQMVLSYNTLGKYMTWLANEDYWAGGDSRFQGYILLKPDTEPQTVEAGLEQLIKPYTDQNHSQYKAFSLLPFPAIHFDTQTGENFNYATPKWLLYVLGSAGLFLVLIACINFINISIVQAVQRNKETGIRKILVGSKRQIVAGFVVETCIIVALSLFTGAMLANLLMPHVGSLLNTHAAQATNWNIGMWMFIGATTVFVTVLAGVYPALAISRFQPIALTRAKFSAPDNKGFSLRQSLVVTQFVIAQILVICTLIGIRQVGYLYNKELGFDKAAIVTVNMPETESVLRERFKARLQQHAAVTDVTYGLTTPSSTYNWWWGTVKYHGLENGEQRFRQQFVDTNYFHFFQIPLVAGRVFSLSDTANSVAMINEKAAHNMGFLDASEAVGGRVEIWGDTYEITGIVQDYHSQSLKDAITPHIYLYNGNFQKAAIRIDPSQRNAAINLIGREWKRVFPDYFFEYNFLDDELNTFYSDEKKLAGILSLFSAISIVIGCLGIYGLVSFICKRKTKEIGIRKVLGASVLSIVSLLSTDFVRLVLISIAIASPIAWWTMNNWLEDFAYHIDIQWWMFAISGLAAVVLALFTVGWQAAKAAMANPVESLRDE